MQAETRHSGSLGAESTLVCEYDQRMKTARSGSLSRCSSGPTGMIS